MLLSLFLVLFFFFKQKTAYEMRISDWSADVCSSDLIKLHPRVAKIYDDRRKMAAGAQAGDWGFAENLAYATLLEDGYKLRLVGQDSGRGTVFHRHAILHDQATDAYYEPLRQLPGNSVDVPIIHPLLTEAAVMGFAYRSRAHER